MMFDYTINPGVETRIQKELDKIGYTFIAATRKSKHPNDKHLYVVVAKRDTDTSTYAFWSCYNDTRQSLNHGHYGYINLVKCCNDASEFVY